MIELVVCAFAMAGVVANVAKLPDLDDGSEKKKRTVQKLTNGDRKWICKRKIIQPHEKFAEMITAFRQERNPEVELKSGTVSGILKQQDKWLAIPDGQENGARTRSSKEPELETALYAWRSSKVDAGEKVRDEDLRNRAKDLAVTMGINTDRNTKGLSFSSGWLDRFKKRNGIKQTCYNRHRGDVEGDQRIKIENPNLMAMPPMALQGGMPSMASMPHHELHMPPMDGMPHLSEALPHGMDHHGIPQILPALPQPEASLAQSHGLPSLPQSHLASLAQPHHVPLPHMDMMGDLPHVDMQHGMSMGMHDMNMVHQQEMHQAEMHQAEMQHHAEMHHHHHHHHHHEHHHELVHPEMGHHQLVGEMQPDCGPTPEGLPNR